MCKNSLSAGMLLLICVSSDHAQDQRAVTPGQAGEANRASRREAYFNDPRFAARPYPRFQLLLNYPAIQQELKLTPAQQAKLAKIQDDVGRQAADTRATLKSVAAQQTNPAAAQAIRHQASFAGVLLGAEAEPAMLRVLNRPQRARLDEVRLQACGLAAFLLPEVQERLNLAPEQIAMFQELIYGLRAEEIRQHKEQRQREIQAVRSVTDAASPPNPSPRPGGPPEAQRTRQERPDAEQSPTITPRQKEALRNASQAGDKGWARMHRAAVNQSIAKVLSKKQRALYQKMLGKPFIAHGLLVRKPAAEGSGELEMTPAVHK